MNSRNIKRVNRLKEEKDAVYEKYNKEIKRLHSKLKEVYKNSTEIN